MAMKQEHILITGCGGMLGASMYELCIRSGAQVLATDIDLNEAWLEPLDVRDIQACMAVFERFKPTIVLHLAALTDLEFCEQNPDEAWKVNALGTENIALLAQRSQCTMVYISTAGVFDGRQDTYTDFDQPRPLSFYAKAKYHGEVFVQHHLSRYFIFRAGWMMGGGPGKDKKFINKIYKQIKAGCTELYVVEDKLGNPTYTVNFAESILKVLPTGYYGLYNQVCTGSGSRYDVAVEFVRLLGLENQIEVIQVDSDHFKKEYFAPRPYSEKLVNLKLDTRNINYMRNWKDCLHDYSKVFCDDYHAEI
jgi:dTDP-4-dehydrorhamnose reductase